MLVQPYLFFDGRCEEAIEFYKRAVGANVAMLVRFKDSPDPPPPGMVPPGSENKVMHATLTIGESTVMASDGECGGKPSFQGFSLSLTVANYGQLNVGQQQANAVLADTAAGATPRRNQRAVGPRSRDARAGRARDGNKAVRQQNGAAAP